MKHLAILNLYNKEDFTVSPLIIDGEAKFVLLQDEARNIKVAGETRLFDGPRKLVLRREVTPLTAKYRKNPKLKGIFDFHIEIIGDPQFKNTYIHIGNFTKDTDGCPLIGYAADIQNGTVSRSTEAYIEFYKMVRPLLETPGSYIPIDILTFDSGSLKKLLS